MTFSLQSKRRWPRLRTRLMVLLLSLSLNGFSLVAATPTAQAAKTAELSQARVESKLDALQAKVDKLLTNHPEQAAALSPDVDHLLKSFPDSPKAASLYSSLSWAYRELGDFDRAMAYAKRAEAAAKTSRDPAELAGALNAAVAVNWARGRSGDALADALKVHAIWKKLNRRDHLAKSFNNIGLLYESLGNFPKAVANFLDSLRLKEELGDDGGRASTLNNLAIVYNEIGRHEKALDALLKALPIQKKLGNKPIVADLLDNIGYTYQLEGKFKEALKYHFQSLALEKELGRQAGISASMNQISGVYNKLGRPEDALRYSRMSLAINRKIGSAKGIATSYYHAGLAEYTLKQFTPAIDSLTRAEKAATGVDDKVLHRNILDTLMRAYAAAGDFQKAYAAQTSLRSVEKQLLNAESQNRIQELETRYQTEKKDQEIKLLTLNRSVQDLALKRNSQEIVLLEQHNAIYRLVWESLIGALLLMTVIAVILYRRYQYKRKAEAKLREQNEEIVRQKEILEQQGAKIGQVNRDLQIVNLKLRELSQAVEQSPNSVIITDSRGDIIFVNRRFTVLTGYEFAEVRGKNPRFLKSGRQPDSFYAELWKTITDGRSWRGEFENRTRDGRIILEATSIFPVFNELGEIYNFVAVSEDVTERKRQEAQMVRYRVAAGAALAEDQTKTAVLARIAGEMRGLLSRIHGIATKDQREPMKAIGTDAARLLEMVSEVLAFSRVDGGSVNPRNLPYEPRKILVSVVEMYREEWKGRRIDVVSEVDANMPEWVMGDGPRLYQILMLLVDHADGRSSGNPVHMNARAIYQPGDSSIELLFEVRDTGPGLEERELDRLFEGGLEASENIDHRTGLSICREMVDLLGGDLSATSQPAGGLSIRFSIKGRPYHDRASASRSVEAPGSDSMRGFAAAHPLRILVADDLRVNRQVMETLLRQFGYDPVFAHDGEEVLAEMNRQPFDLVLMDLHMPKVSGRECARRIRAGEVGKRNRNVQILAVTGYAVEPAGSDGDIDGLLAKPLSVERLREEFIRVSRENGKRRPKVD